MGLLKKLFGAPPRPAITTGAGISDFFAFRDVLFVRGVVGRLEGPAPAISIRLWDGELYPVAYLGDKYIPTTDQHWSFNFHHPLPPGASADQISKITLVFDYEAGRFELPEPTRGGEERDQFNASEKGFWDAVRANPTAKVLEIGSRARSGISRRNLFPATCEYTGFDIAPGENVTVVGDAHALSRHLPAGHFDFAFSVSTWEHLSMPWLVSVELNKVMKPGGLAMINSHQSWPVHEEPWDYFRFSDFAWDSLFNAATGFEIVARGMGWPCVMGPSRFIPSMHADPVEWHYGYLSTRCVARKISGTTLTWPVDPGLISKGKYSH